MKVSFIVPLYNGLALTRQMLATLSPTVPAGLEHEIILVDDTSTDGTRAWLQAEARLVSPVIQVVLNEVNLGFAGTCNRGAKVATGDVLCFLNNDLEFSPGWLEPLLSAHARLGPKAGLTGNLQYRVDDGRLDHAGIYVSTQAKLEHIRELPRQKSPHEVFAVTAACCVVSRDAFQAVGGFDEGFRNGGEDVDLALRLRATGRRTVVVPGSAIRHHVSAARGPTSQRDEANSRRLYSRWKGEIEKACARSWATNPLHERAGSRMAQITDWLHLRGLSPKLSLGTRQLAQSAVHREQARWQSLFDPNNPATLPDGPYAINGLRFDGPDLPGWIHDRATLILPAGFPTQNLFLSGELFPADPILAASSGELGIRITINGLQSVSFTPLPLGHFNLGVDCPASLPDRPSICRIELLGVARTNWLGILDRVTENWPLPSIIRAKLAPHRRRPLNRRLWINRVVADDRLLFTFAGQSHVSAALRLKNKPAGLNITGWFRAELGLGEGARCMVRACDATGLPTALVDLKLNCLSRREDKSFVPRLQSDNPHPINVFHVDPPVARDLDHHHGASFRRDKYNIAYWAWELPEFPETWAAQADYFDEIWCPSDFVRTAIAAKVRIPVVTMPHAIDLRPPSGDGRVRFGLPVDRKLFLCLYDLNSFQERKNPLAAIAAYRRAFPDEAGVGLVIKTQNATHHPAAFAQLQQAVAGCRHVRIIAETLDRADVTMLQSCCDAYVSLHRAEGFGLAVAECMALGRPVISTDWSATAEFVNEQNGCPVRTRLVRLEDTHGPYAAGQQWADPDVEHAAWWLRRLYAEPELSSRLGHAAQETMRDRFSPASIGARYSQRLNALGLKS